MPDTLFNGPEVSDPRIGERWRSNSWVAGWATPGWLASR
jgi:hypothetical protein